MRPDLNLADYSMDLVKVSFDATLAGTIELSTSNPELIIPGYFQIPIVEAAAVYDNGLRLDTASSAIARSSIGFTNTTAYLDLNVNFAGFGALNRNQTSIGRYINRVQRAGSKPDLSTLITDLFQLPAMSGEQNLAAAYNSLSPEIYTTSFTNPKFA